MWENRGHHPTPIDHGVCLLIVSGPARAEFAMDVCHFFCLHRDPRLNQELIGGMYYDPVCNVSCFAFCICTRLLWRSEAYVQTVRTVPKLGG